MTMRHHDIEHQLYDHVTGELPPAVHAEVDAHLAGCERCRAERDEIARMHALLPSAGAAPSDRLGEAYWSRFADGVDARIRAEGRTARIASSFWETVRSYVQLHRGPSWGLAAAGVAVVCAVFLLGRLSAPVPLPGVGSEPAREVAREEAPEKVREEAREVAPSGKVIPASDRLERYLRKSKVLLVGLTNMKHEPGEPVDLKAERQLSRSLIKEARYLKTQDIDVRSARLIDDLTRILIELANLEDEHDLPDVEIIRGGINQENLLFKIRMAELLHDSTARTNPTF